MRDSETFKEMECAKTNDQQWNRMVFDSFDVPEPDHSARPFLDTSGTRPRTVRAESSAAPKPSVTGTALPRTTRH